MNGQLPFSLALTLRRTTSDQIDMDCIDTLAPPNREYSQAMGQRLGMLYRSRYRSSQGGHR